MITAFLISLWQSGLDECYKILKEKCGWTIGWSPAVMMRLKKEVLDKDSFLLNVGEKGTCKQFPCRSYCAKG